MASQAKGNGGSSGGFRARMEHYLYSGDKKHVFAGIAMITIVFGAPWFLMNRGAVPSLFLPESRFFPTAP